ncbi:MAG: accessory Sec system translocase SecA2 [Clostridiaceae bacterium]
MLKNNTSVEKYKNTVEQIKKVQLTSARNEDLLNMSNKLRKQALEGVEIDKLLVEGFALVKEAVKRTLGFEVYDVQLLAAVALNNKKMIEMKTGEGKTLASVFPAYLNCLLKKGVHILTFNDYLAKRDALWMKPIYEMLGITVGFVQEKMDNKTKKEAYNCDITYVTAKEAGFDYLRDSLTYNKEDLIHRPFYFAIADEADSILIDEAKIPLVIAVSTEEKDSNLKKVRDAVVSLGPFTDYKTDEYSHNVYLTEAGINHIESFFKCDNLYHEENLNLLRQVNNALYAEVLLKKDIDYIIRNNIVEMVDEFTGRVAKNRHWPDGLQAALECKENLEIQSNGRIMTQITLQHFIRLYENLAGMTGTAIDSTEEFFEFYDMDVAVIPPNKKSLRKDLTPYVFTHKEAKYKAIVEEIKKVHTTGQPILVGTSSVKESSHLAEQLINLEIKCQVLNAKNDELEAHIIEKAGVLGAVTVSTNMAGRGIDIVLGGPSGECREKIKKLGGLYVIGTNLYESLRVDKQLMGRSGRQGDPGTTRFFVSLEDDLIIKYGIQNIIPKIYLPKNQNEPLSNPIFIKKLYQVQRIIQGQNSDIRRDLYDYSTILDGQRQYIYNNRMKIFNGSFTDEILESKFPKLYENMKSKYSNYELSEFIKNIRLYHMNQCWSDYLIKVANFQEGLSLNITAGKNPLREFHMKLIEEFKFLLEEINEAIENDYSKFETFEITLDDINERYTPPASTWTYLVNDNSFADTIGLLKGFANAIGSTKSMSKTIFSIEYKYNKLFKKERT